MDAIISNKYLTQNNIDSNLLIVDPLAFNVDSLDSMNYFTSIDKLNFSDYLYSYPSIVVWVPFNEAWGQFKTVEITRFGLQKIFRHG